MSCYVVPPIYAVFVWWFSTGAVLLLVGRWGQSDALRIVCAGALLIAALCGLSASVMETSVPAAFLAFSCTILLWGTQEIAFLAGWLTGPRPAPCPPGLRGWPRLKLALQAILYHELALLSCGAVVLALSWGAPNPVAPWTFAALWVLRQSAKINLFLGVPVTNDELMPEPVQFLKSFFARKPVSAFFPVSVTLSIAVLVILIQRIVEVAETPFDIVGLTLVSTLFALGVVEHWFMLLPLPAIKLWGWGVRSDCPPEAKIMETDSAAKLSLQGPQVAESPPTSPDARAASPQRVALPGPRNDDGLPKPRTACARQRLEDQFRQSFLEQHPRADLAPARIGIEPAATGNGRTA